MSLKQAAVLRVIFVGVSMSIGGFQCPDVHGIESLPAGVIQQLDSALPKNAASAASMAAFAPDGKSFAVLISGDWGRCHLELRDAAKGDIIWSRDIGDVEDAASRPSYNGRPPTHVLHFTNDGKQIVTVLATVRVADGHVTPFTLTGEKIFDVSQDARYGVTISEAGTRIRLFDLRAGKPGSILATVKEVTDDNDDIFAPAAPPKGRRFDAGSLQTCFLPDNRVAVCHDGNSTVHSMSDGKKLFRRSYSDIHEWRDLAVAANGKFLAVVDKWGGRIELIDLSDGQPSRLIREPRPEFRACQIESVDSGTKLAAHDLSDGVVKLFDLADGKWLDPFPVETKCHAFALSPDGKKMVACGDRGDGTALLLWDIASRRRLNVRQGPQVPFSELLFAPSGCRLAAKTSRTWYFYDLPSGNRSGPITVPRIDAMSSDGWLIAEGDSPSGIRLRRSSNGEIVFRQSNIDWPGFGHLFAFDSELSQAVTVSEDGQLSLLDIAARNVRRFEPRDRERHKRVESASIAPDGKIVAACLENESLPGKTIELWDVASGKIVDRLVAPQEPEHPSALAGGGIVEYIPARYFRVQFIGSSSTVAAWRRDGVVDIWDVLGKQRLYELRVSYRRGDSDNLFLNDGQYYVRHDAHSFEVVEIRSNRSCFVRSLASASKEPMASQEILPQRQLKVD